MTEPATLVEAAEQLDAIQPLRFRPYPDRRDSGIEWLGCLPSHWDVCRAKHVATLKSGHTPSRQKAEYWINCSIPWFTLADVWQLRNRGQKYLGDTAEKISELGLRHSAADLLPQGTVILSRTASVGFTGIMPRAMATSQDFVNWVCGPRLLPDYLWYVFRAMRPEFDRLIQGSTHKTIYMPDARAFNTPVPSLDEQRAIAVFLDRETARIDELIAKKQRLIELLAEKRTALISHAVTKGLNPDAPMKDAGVECMGEVPQHWHLKQLKFAVTFQRGHDLPSSERVSGTVPVVTSAGPSSWHDRAAAKGPGIVTGRYGTIGTFHLVEEDFWPLNTTLYSINLRGNVPRFLWYMLHLLSGVFLVNSAKSAVPGVDRNDLHPIRVAVPPKNEQEAIVKHLDVHLGRHAGLTNQVEAAIRRLREYRSALISAAVTGKIDVRN